MGLFKINRKYSQNLDYAQLRFPVTEVKLAGFHISFSKPDSVGNSDLLPKWKPPQKCAK